MIKGFACKYTQSLWESGVSSIFSAIIKVALRKLDIIDAAHTLNDLKSPPANRLELLKGDRKGQHSIRINDKYRICFKWLKNDAEKVEIVDYHK